ncbi:25255_t:CDS:1, partial [Gigaspora rosea]
TENYVLVEHTEPLPTYTPREDTTSSTATQTLGTVAPSNIAPPTEPLINATSPSHSTANSNSVATPPVAPGELPPSYDEVAS